MVRTLWATTRKVAGNFQKRLSRTLSNTTAELYRYETIPLRLYIEIASNGRIKKLIKRGWASLEECVTAWEAIIKKNSTVTGSFEYDSYFYLLQGYWLLVAEHTIVKTALLKLTTVIDWEAIQEVRTRGYKIDIGPGYTQSLNNALRKVENLITKARMKEKEISRSFSNSKPSERPSFDAVMAGLVSAIGFEIRDDITLSRFNEYKKIVQERNKQMQERRQQNQHK